MEYITKILLLATGYLLGEWLYCWLFGYKRIWIKTESLLERTKKRHKNKQRL